MEPPGRVANVNDNKRASSSFFFLFDSAPITVNNRRLLNCCFVLITVHTIYRISSTTFLLHGNSQQCLLRVMVFIRETREGWPLLTVETEVNGNSKSTNEKSPSLVGSLGSSCRSIGFYPALAALVSPVQNICLTHRTLFQFMYLLRIETWAGSRAGPPVSECVVSGLNSPVISEA
jgi:hypothetical protein